MELPTQYEILLAQYESKKTEKKVKEDTTDDKCPVIYVDFKNKKVLRVVK